MLLKVSGVVTTSIVNVCVENKHALLCMVLISFFYRFTCFFVGILYWSINHRQSTTEHSMLLKVSEVVTTSIVNVCVENKHALLCMVLISFFYRFTCFFVGILYWSINHRQSTTEHSMLLKVSEVVTTSIVNVCVENKHALLCMVLISFFYRFTCFFVGILYWSINHRQSTTEHSMLLKVSEVVTTSIVNVCVENKHALLCMVLISFFYRFTCFFVGILYWSINHRQSTTEHSMLLKVSEVVTTSIVNVCVENKHALLCMVLISFFYRFTCFFVGNLNWSINHRQLTTKHSMLLKVSGVVTTSIVNVCVENKHALLCKVVISYFYRFTCFFVGNLNWSINHRQLTTKHSMLLKVSGVVTTGIVNVCVENKYALLCMVLISFFYRFTCFFVGNLNCSINHRQLTTKHSMLLKVLGVVTTGIVNVCVENKYALLCMVLISFFYRFTCYFRR